MPRLRVYAPEVVKTHVSCQATKGSAAVAVKQGKYNYTVTL